MTDAPARRDVTRLHHVTGITGDAQANHDFYAGALGLRFVKRTVNFDDPSAYHLYYGDAVGGPGSAITFFAWPRAFSGRRGVGETTLVRYAAPAGALEAWEARLGGRARREEAFGAPRLVTQDPDGAAIAIVEAPSDPRAGGPDHWTRTHGASALLGFEGVTLAIRARDLAPMSRLLTEAFDFRAEGRDGDAHRFRGADGAGVVDLAVSEAAERGVEGAGTVHHVAFSVADLAAQDAVRARVAALGLQPTPTIDRTYFRSIYFRTPAGVLFEVATDGPGFTVDEPRESLGAALMLPERYEPSRERIARALPPLRFSPVEVTPPA